MSTQPSSHFDPEAYWMPFTANRRYKRDPVLFDSAEGMYYHRPDGRKVLDGIAGLWCVNAGHRRPEVVQAIAHCAHQLDYAPSFQMGHPLAFQFAEALCAQAPGDLSHVFFSNSGSEAVDTALKIALGYHKARGQGQRVRLIGRERSYHGVGFGGLSVSGIAGHRKNFGNLLPYVDYLPHTYDRAQMAYTRGQPAWGLLLANELERIVALHDASTIAAVIVEPVAGSTGVLVPPQGYLQRLRDICDRHGILLIFDEVICAFGRLGASFASERFGVVPDIVTCAKGLTNGAIPMGATLVRDAVYQAYMDAPEGAIELSHGYTYSGHPVACAAGLATLAIHQREGLAQRARELEPYWEDAAHSLRGLPGVVDIRNIGLLAAVELESLPGKAGQRGFGVHQACLEKGSLIRSSGDAMLLSPPLVIDKPQIDQLFSTLSEVLLQGA
jgi:beta-alanine--pyruvate transaminase